MNAETARTLRPNSAIRGSGVTLHRNVSSVARIDRAACPGRLPSAESRAARAGRQPGALLTEGSVNYDDHYEDHYVDSNQGPTRELEEL